MLEEKEPMKNQKGFTLVEAIVVAVIVAVLAVTAVMLYQGYITEARQNTVNNLAETAAASANAYFRRTGTAIVIGDLAPNTAPLNLYYDNTKYQMTLAGTGNNSIKVVYIPNNTIAKTVPYK
jgi:prepilin-type N-terminal cleavage/methylation domain-containing protein